MIEVGEAWLMVGALGVASGGSAAFAELEYDSVEIIPTPSASMRRIPCVGAGDRKCSLNVRITPLYFESIVAAHRQVTAGSTAISTNFATLEKQRVATMS